MPPTTARPTAFAVSGRRICAALSMLVRDMIPLPSAALHAACQGWAMRPFFLQPLLVPRTHTNSCGPLWVHARHDHVHLLYYHHHHPIFLGKHRRWLSLIVHTDILADTQWSLN